MWGITFLSLCLATPAVPFGLLWLFQGVVFLYCVVIDSALIHISVSSVKRHSGVMNVFTNQFTYVERIEG